MKTGGALVLLACLALTGRIGAATNDSVFVAYAEDSWRIDAGADFRIRQEIMDNLPGLPGGGWEGGSPGGKKISGRALPFR